MIWSGLLGSSELFQKHVLLDERKLFDNAKMVQDLSPVSSGMWSQVQRVETESEGLGLLHQLMARYREYILLADLI